jgi:hypothetical protein
MASVLPGSRPTPTLNPLATELLSLPLVQDYPRLIEEVKTLKEALTKEVDIAKELESKVTVLQGVIQDLKYEISVLKVLKRKKRKLSNTDSLVTPESGIVVKVESESDLVYKLVGTAENFVEFRDIPNPGFVETVELQYVYLKSEVLLTALKHCQNLNSLRLLHVTILDEIKSKVVDIFIMIGSQLSLSAVKNAWRFLRKLQSEYASCE